MPGGNPSFLQSREQRPTQTSSQADLLAQLVQAIRQQQQQQQPSQASSSTIFTPLPSLATRPTTVHLPDHTVCALPQSYYSIPTAVNTQASLSNAAAVRLSSTAPSAALMSSSASSRLAPPSPAVWQPPLPPLNQLTTPVHVSVQQVADITPQQAADNFGQRMLQLSQQQNLPLSPVQQAFLNFIYTLAAASQQRVTATTAALTPPPPQQSVAHHQQQQPLLTASAATAAQQAACSVNAALRETTLQNTLLTAATLVPHLSGAALGSLAAHVAQTYETFGATCTAITTTTSVREEPRNIPVIQPTPVVHLTEAATSTLCPVQLPVRTRTPPFAGTAMLHPSTISPHLPQQGFTLSDLAPILAGGVPGGPSATLERQCQLFTTASSSLMPSLLSSQLFHPLLVSRSTITASTCSVAATPTLTHHSGGIVIHPPTMPPSLTSSTSSYERICYGQLPPMASMAQCHRKHRTFGNSYSAPPEFVNGSPTMAGGAGCEQKPTTSGMKRCFSETEHLDGEATGDGVQEDGAADGEVEHSDSDNPLIRVREFAQQFKMRRLALGLTQTQVGRALTKAAGPSYSQSAICRFEKLDITKRSAQKIMPVLQRWMCDEERRLIHPPTMVLLPVAAPVCARSSSLPTAGSFVVSEGLSPQRRSFSTRTVSYSLSDCSVGSAEKRKHYLTVEGGCADGGEADSPELVDGEADGEASAECGAHRSGKKRKRRTSFNPQALDSLNDFFALNEHPSSREVSELADRLDYEREVIRVWFCNKRQAKKNSVRRLRGPGGGVGGASTSSTSFP